MKRGKAEAPMNEPGRRTQSSRGRSGMSAAAAPSCGSAPLPPLGAGRGARAHALERLSRGTERLVFEGRVAAVESERMRAPLQEGDFPFPVKYGYCAVGVVEEGPRDLVGRTVFALHPHQDRFVAPAAMPRPRAATACRRAGRCSPPTWRRRSTRCGIPAPGRATASWWSAPAWSGSSSALLAARLPGAEVTLVDVDLSRADARRAVSAAPSRSRSTRPATPTSCSMPARPRPASPAPWPAPASRRRSSR